MNFEETSFICLHDKTVSGSRFLPAHSAHYRSDMRYIITAYDLIKFFFIYFVYCKSFLLDDKDLADYLKQNEFSFGSGFNYSVPFINLFFGDDSRLEFADLTSKRTIMRLIYDFKETLIYYFLQFIKDHPDKFTTDELKQYLLDNLIINFSALENGSTGNK